MIINMNGAKAPETPSSVLQEKTVTPETLPTVIGPDEGYDGLSQVTVNPDSQLKAENIRSGKTIFGVTGAFTGETSYIDFPDYKKFSNVSSCYPIMIILVGEYRLNPILAINTLYGVEGVFSKENKPSVGSASIDWADNYIFNYGNSDKRIVITENITPGTLSSYVGNYGYLPVTLDFPEGDYPAKFIFINNGTVKLKPTMTYFAFATNSTEELGTNPTSPIYANNDSYTVAEQEITVSKGMGMIHLPEIHSSGYVSTYSEGTYYYCVSLNIFGFMEVDG